MKKFLLMRYKLFFAFIFCIAGTTCIAQDFSAYSLPKKFISYQANNYTEKIFVHTDKTFYIIGESIWFKIYCVEEGSNKLSAISKIAYVEIINRENKAVLQAKIAMDSGTGNGSFIIPSFISSGNYILRAYTKWMENFDSDYFFQQPLTIINNLKSVVGTQTNHPKKYIVSFFPEGGNLVEGTTSKLAFKAVDEYGEAVDCSGNILDAHNSVVTSFETLKFGMGNLNFTPKAGENYKAVIKLDDTTIEEPLPTVYKQGYVMHLENADEPHIKITVSSNVAGSNTVYLLVHSQNVIKDFQQRQQSAGEIVFMVEKNKLSDGISSFTIFNSNKQPVCERLYFKRPASKLNIQMQPDKKVYQLRQPVSISLNTTTNLNEPALANMSASVFMIDSLQPPVYTDIASYLLLSTELKGNIQSPGYYFQNAGKEVDEAADNLMLTQGWRRFKWGDVLTDKKPYIQFLPEYEGIMVNGKITARYGAFPVNEISATLTVPGKNFQLAGAKTDASGNIFFNVRNFYGANDIIIQTDSNYKAEIISPYSNNFSSTPAPLFRMSFTFKDELLFRSINAQADNAYIIDKKQHAYVYNTEDTSLFYGTPDKTYLLDDYTRFTTMEEVMREYVAEVRVRKEAQQFQFRVLNYLTKSFLDNDPLILLDGLPVLNTNNIIEFDPLKIKRLDIIAGKHYYGNITSDGIVSYATYNGDLANWPLNAGDVIVQFDGLQREREFYSPVYSGEKTEKHLPDLRNVLYCTPHVKTNGQGNTILNFYTSDLPGKFACVVQGIAADGTTGSNIIILNVTNN
jgi:hypothetical protein